jgi:hypothetical protein
MNNQVQLTIDDYLKTARFEGAEARSFYPDLGYEWGTQKRKMYDHLKIVCSCTNSDFVNGMHVFKYTNRISEIRKDLEVHGWTIRAERLHDGLFEYHLERRGL